MPRPRERVCLQDGLKLDLNARNGFIRQGARSITQLEILPTPPDERPDHQPWPTYPMIYRVSSAHEEAGDRVYSVSTSEFHGDENSRVTSLTLSEVKFEGGS